jgi:hypothetical protein
MQETFTILSKSFSINSMYNYKNNRKFKTLEAEKWETGILHQLSSKQNMQKFENLRSQFDPELHSYAVTISVYYPEADFYTKKGLISAHTHDVSNYEKPLIDLLFLPKYFELPAPYGCKNLNMDDKYITRMFSTKRPGTEHKLIVKIKIINRK